MVISDKWTVEIVQDVEVSYGDGVELELLRALMYEEGKNPTQTKLCDYGDVIILRCKRGEVL